MVPVPVTVRLVRVVVSHTFPAPLIVTVPELSCRVLVFELVEAKAFERVMLYVFALSVPAVTVKRPPLKASWIVSVLDDESIVIS